MGPQYGRVEALNVIPMQNVKRILDTTTIATTENPVCKLQWNEIEGTMGTDEKN